MNTTITALLQPVHQIWQHRSVRERLLLQMAAWLIGLAVLWTLGLAPALRIWQAAPDRQTALDRQTQQMLQWQSEARRLTSPQAITRAEAVQWLQAHVAALGPKAKLQMQAEQMQLTLEATPAEALAQWLGQAREHAHVRPLQAQLQQTTSPSGEAVTGVAWSGSMVLGLP